MSKPTPQASLRDFLFQPEPTTTAAVAPELSSFLETATPMSAPITVSVPTKAPAWIEALTHPFSQTVSSVPNSPSATSWIPRLLGIIGRILQDLETHPDRVLQLNPSRRQTIVEHLETLANQGTAPSNKKHASLQDWMEHPKTAAHSAALKTFYHEIALITLGQALLLKTWSDRRVRTLLDKDFSNLNWALLSTIKPYIPLDRESWLITRQNIYSWYVPSLPIQEELRTFLQGVTLEDESPGILFELLSLNSPSLPDWPEVKGYDSRFLRSLWTLLTLIDPRYTSADKRPTFAFSASLRDGHFQRLGPRSLQWIGFESYPLLLLYSELAQLWKGPGVSPLWTQGQGLTGASQEQFQLQLAPRVSLLERIQEIESCELSVLFEERTFKPSQSREAREEKAWCKKWLNHAGSVGLLQAMVSLSKLRPGGYFLWLRERPLTRDEGQDALKVILEQAKLVCEWDFSPLAHSLPSVLPLYSTYIYLFQRENRLEERLAHRPKRVQVQGQLRSHIEVPQFLDEALRALVQVGSGKINSKGGWEILAEESPFTQKDWIDQWPDALAPERIRRLDLLRTQSIPLGSVATVRGPATDWSRTPKGSHLWIKIRENENGEFHFVPCTEPQAKDAALVAFPSESWVAPISTYLQSTLAGEWLTTHQRRIRHHRHLLSEADTRLIPIPRSLAETLSEEEAGTLDHLSTEMLRRRILELSTRGTSLSQQFEGKHLIRAYIEGARLLALADRELLRYQSLVDPRTGTLNWGAVMKLLPPTEVIPLGTDPRVKLNGSLPVHTPVASIERMQNPAPAVFLATEKGHMLTITCDHTLLLRLIYEQLEGLRSHHPTWNEIIAGVNLPRRLEVFETTANDILKSYGEIQNRKNTLHTLLESTNDGCPIFIQPQPARPL